MGRNFSSPVFAGHRVESSRQAAVVVAAVAIVVKCYVDLPVMREPWSPAKDTKVSVKKK